jgi:rod shape determining protein RodA
LLSVQHLIKGHTLSNNLINKFLVLFLLSFIIHHLKYKKIMIKKGYALPQKSLMWWDILIYPFLILCISILCLSSIYNIYHKSVFLQTCRGLGGLLGAFILMFIPIQTWFYSSSIFYSITLGLLVTVACIGRIGMHAKRWVMIGNINLQPSEFIKMSLIMGIAYTLCNKHHQWSLMGMVKLFGMVGAPMLLTLLQPDLGTAVMMSWIVAGMIWIRGIPGKWVLLIIIFLGFSLPIIYHWGLLPYQKQRLVTFIYPHEKIQSSGYQVNQSRIAIGSGGLWGKGWKKGTQNQMDFLPERHSDFIFGVWAEEWGFIGTIILLILYAFFIGRLFFIAFILRKTQPFGAFITLGVAQLIGGHAWINIGMTLGIFPVVGVPLPFMSYGGSALFTYCWGLGCVLSACRRYTLNNQELA